MTENPIITVEIYQDGRPTGKIEEIDLNNPREAEKLIKSLSEQDGEFD